MEKCYNLFYRYFDNHSISKMVLTFIYRYFPIFTMIVYFGCLLYVSIFSREQLLLLLIKPMIVFLFTGIFRKIYNRQRPYETLSITPTFIHKNGESFPSRHTASAFVIAFICFEVSSVLGIFMLCIASCIAVSRVLAGVHYPSDVLAGFLISYILCLIKW